MFSSIPLTLCCTYHEMEILMMYYRARKWKKNINCDPLDMSRVDFSVIWKDNFN